jgi:hypothetical protein
MGVLVVVVLPGAEPVPEPQPVPFPEGGGVSEGKRE